MQVKLNRIQTDEYGEGFRSLGDFLENFRLMKIFLFLWHFVGDVVQVVFFVVVTLILRRRHSAGFLK